MPATANLMDDFANEFMSFGFQLFYIDVKMLTDRRQLVTIFGKGLEGDVVTYKDGEIYPFMPFIKEIDKMGAFSGSDQNYSKTFDRRIKSKKDREYQYATIRKEDFKDRKSVADKLLTAVKLMEAQSEANFMIEITQRLNGEGQVMKITIKKIIANAILPVVFNILKIFEMRDEMNINRLIRPVLKKNYGALSTTINIEDSFLYLMPPDGTQETALVFHAPEISILSATEWKDKLVTAKQELPSFFDEKEFAYDEMFRQLLDNPEILIKVNQLSAAINNVYMDLVAISDFETYIKGRVVRDQSMNISRNIMQPFFLAYQNRDWTFCDSANEMKFFRGAGNIGAVNLLINTNLINYLLGWMKRTELQNIKNMQIQGVYEAHLRTIIKKAQLIEKPNIRKIRFNQMDIVYQGTNLTMLDDIYNTNLPLFHFMMPPVTITQVENRSYVGIKGLSATMEASYFNYNSFEWEPVLENFAISIDSYREQGDSNDNKLSISFADKNPSINVTSELDILAESILNKINTPSKLKNSEDLRQMMINQAMKQSSLRQSTYADYDALAFLDKFRILHFIQNLPNQSYEHSRLSTSSLDHTRLYGYDDLVTSNYNFNQKTLNQHNFEEKASLKPKNPLNYRYNDRIPQGQMAQRQSQLASQFHDMTHSHVQQSQLMPQSMMMQQSRTSRQGMNPLHSHYKETMDVQLSPTIIERLSRENIERPYDVHSQIYIREIPFRVENMSGRDIVFSITFFDIPKMVYVSNIDARDLEFPFTLENTLLQNGHIKSRSRHVGYKIFEVDPQGRSYLLHQGSSLHKIMSIKIPYGQSITTDESNLKYLILEVKPLVMKKNILLRSPLEICSECASHIQMHFLRQSQLVYTLQTVKDNFIPVPVDLLDTYMDIDVTNVSKQSDFTLPAINLFSSIQEPVVFQMNEFYFLHLFTIVHHNYRRTYIVPPLVLKNMFFVGMNLEISRVSLEREYFDSYRLEYDSKHYEVFAPLTDKFSFKINMGVYESDRVDIKLHNSRHKELLGSTWVRVKGKKKFTLNYSLFFDKGSYFLTIYCQHLIFDELFKRTIFSQRGDRFEEQLTSLEMVERDSVMNNYSKSLLESTILADASQVSLNEKLRHRSTIYFLPFPKNDIWVADQKDPYEIASIDTAQLGDQTNSFRSVSRTTNAVGFYDLVATNSIFTLCNRPQIVANITRIRHKYLMHNKCDHEILVRQLKFRDSIEQTVKQDRIVPVYFSPQDNNSEQRFVNIGLAGFEWSDRIEISKPNLNYFMLKNILDKSLNEVNGIHVERYITFSLEVTIENGSYLLTVRRESSMGSFRFINNLDNMVVFLSQDPRKLEANVAEVAMHPQTWVYYSWPNTFTKPRDLYFRLVETGSRKMSLIHKLEYKETARSYDLLGTRVYHYSEFAGASMVIKFSGIVNPSERRKLKNTLTANIPYLGLSVIGGKGNTRRELIFLSLIGIEATQLTYEKVQKLKVSIMYVNIDNTTEFLSYYPILFSPKYSFETIREHGLRHIDFYMKTINFDEESPVKMTILNTIDLRLLGNVLKIEESFIHNALNILDNNNKQRLEMNAYQKSLRGRRAALNHKLNEDYKNQLLDKSYENFRTLRERKMMEESRGTTYINQMYISEHDLLISLKREPDEDEKAALNRYSKYLKSVGFDYLWSIEDLLLEFRPFTLESDVYPVSTAVEEIKKQYIKDGIQSAIANLLDLKILGKPRTFAREITKGVQDIAEKPASRLNESKSASGLGRGIAEGAGSFGKHSAVGVLGSVGALTGAASRVTSTLAFDPEYNKRRNQLKSAEVNHVMGRMTSGLDQLGFSMKDSVAGVFRRPVEMTEREGVMGAIKGSFMGVAGLIVKPITGLLDFVSTSANDARDRLSRNDLEPPIERIRHPRAFYGETSFIKKYNENDADVFNLLEKTTGNKYDKLIGYCQVTSGNPDLYQLIINTVGYIYCIDPATKKVEWVVDKTVYYTVKQQGSNTLLFNFRDARHALPQNQAVTFYTREELDNMITSLGDKK